MSSIKFGPLAPLLDDPSLTEIMVNGYNEVYIERAGVIEYTDATFADEHELVNLIEQIAAYVGRRVSAQDAMLDARLPDGSRVNVIMPPLSLSGPVLTIRRFTPGGLSAGDLVENNTTSEAALDFLHACVVARRNVLISGRTGVGKTTLLNVLSRWIPDAQRIITIEDSAELQLAQPHWVRLETRPADVNGNYEATTRHLVRNALRMRPDRIVVGEVRGGEALDMLQAMNTGHDGGIGTIHANSTRDALARMETMVLMAGVELPSRAVREQIVSALNLLVHVKRYEDGVRRVESIAEITGLEGSTPMMQELYGFRRRGKQGRRIVGHFTATGVVPRMVEEMREEGTQVPAALFQKADQES